MSTSAFIWNKFKNFANFFWRINFHLIFFFHFIHKLFALACLCLFSICIYLNCFVFIFLCLEAGKLCLISLSSSPVFKYSSYTCTYVPYRIISWKPIYSSFIPIFTLRIQHNRIFYNKTYNNKTTCKLIKLFFNYNVNASILKYTVFFVFVLLFSNNKQSESH